jgi:SHS family lactate transporter-like MFS transporter
MALAAELRTLNRHQWAAVSASFLGWTLDAFDFFLMVFMFSAIAKEFHTDIPAVAVASTLTLAARPFGALVFGMLADRFGRRPVLVIDILLFSGLEFACAFAPTLTVLMILRALFGFAMGGEWGVGASLAMESIPPKVRGFISGLLQEGYATGFLLASVVYGLLFDRFGWRGMFMVGVIPALLAAFITFGVKESPTFEAQRKTAPKQNLFMIFGVGIAAIVVAMAPAVVGAVVGALDKNAMLKMVYFVDAPIALAGLFLFRKHWRMAIYIVLLMTAFNFLSHGSQDIYPTFLKEQHHLSTQTISILTIIGNLGAIVGGITFGAWSERLGRRWTIVIATVLCLAMIPLWAFSHTVAMLAAGAFLMQVMVQGAWGIIPVHLNELSPPEARGSFPGYAYQVGNLLASGNLVWQAQLAKAQGNNYGLALAVVAGAVAVVIVLLTAFGPERRGVAFEGTGH